jgi:hypothetical protein
MTKAKEKATKKAPKGNAEVGDTAWYRSNSSAPWEKDWEVIEIGIANDHGHPLDVRIARVAAVRSVW